VPRLVERSFQLFRGLVESFPYVPPGSLVLAVSRADPGFQIGERTLSRIDGCFDFVPNVGLQQSGLDAKALKPLFHLQQALLETVLQLAALLVEAHLDGRK